MAPEHVHRLGREGRLTVVPDGAVVLHVVLRREGGLPVVAAAITPDHLSDPPDRRASLVGRGALVDRASLAREDVAEEGHLALPAVAVGGAKVATGRVARIAPGRVVAHE